jgi:hypothetical protein
LTHGDAFTDDISIPTPVKGGAFVLQNPKNLTKLTASNFKPQELEKAQEKSNKM